MRLYSPEWVDAFNEAVSDLTPETGVAFRMRQIVQGAPDGTLQVTLDVGVDSPPAPAPAPASAEGGARISLHVEAGTGSNGDRPMPTDREPQVTVMLAYEDAAALARGDVDPAALLRAGRVKVRGNLSALVAGQRILAEAAGRLGPLSERTTF